MQFIIKKIFKTTESELENIGFDKSYIKQGAEKHDFLSFKIFNLKPQQASILKQCALSLGTDCAVHRHVLDCKIEKSSVILSGSISEIGKISKKLSEQPFSLSKLAKALEAQVEIYRSKPEKTKVMGILNLTPDSFSDGGECMSLKDALEKAGRLIEEGADIIDIGAESTRPGSDAVDSELEIEKIAPTIRALKKEFKNIIISVDTRNSKTAVAAAELGADIINDVSFLNWDENILDAAIKYGKKYVLTHSLGTPQDMDTMCNYENVVDEVYFELYEKLQKVIEKGMKPEDIIVDVGFGFAKDAKQNLDLLKHIEEFRSLGVEVLAGTSRKRFLAPFVSKASEDTPKERDNLTSLTSFYACLKGVGIVRVHNVKLSKESVNLAYALT